MADTDRPDESPGARASDSELSADSEARFRALIELASDLILILDAGGIVRYQSPSVARTLGYPPDHLVDNSFFGFVHSADAPRLLEAFDRLSHSPGDAFDARIRLRHRDGSTRLLDLVARNLIDEPSVHGIVVNARDLTDRDAAEKERGRLGDILQATTDFVGIFDAHGHITYINAAGRRMIGLSDDDDIAGLGISDLHPPAAASRLIEEGITTAIRDGGWSGESILLDRDGSRTPVSQVVLAHRGTSGSLEFLSTIMRDITDRKDVESALRRDEAYFRSLVESATHIVAVLESDGTVRYVNPAVHSVLGLAADDLIGHDALDFLHPDDARDLRARLAAGHLPVDDDPSTPVELRLRHGDGDWHRFSAVGHDLRDDPAVRGIVLHLHHTRTL